MTSGEAFLRRMVEHELEMLEHASDHGMALRMGINANHRLDGAIRALLDLGALDQGTAELIGAPLKRWVHDPPGIDWAPRPISADEVLQEPRAVVPVCRPLGHHGSWAAWILSVERWSVSVRILASLLATDHAQPIPSGTVVKLSLQDDVGTTYRHRSGGASLQPASLAADQMFEPAISEHATSISIGCAVQQRQQEDVPLGSLSVAL